MTEQEKIKLLFDRLLDQKKHPFPKKGRLDITCKKGVYIIYNSRGIVLHVGNTPSGKEGLCQRLNDHIYGASSFANKFLKPRNLTVRNNFKYKFFEVSSARNRVLLEALACGLLCPKHVGTHEKNNI
jgi:hypothetical protein